MAGKMDGQETPAVVPGYGEADDEAASMDKAADRDKAADGAAGGSEAGGQAAAAADAAAKVVPDTAGPVGHGTTETDVKARIAEAASREAEKPAGAD